MIIDKLGGKMDIVGAPGVGATIYFELPPHAQADAQNRSAMHI